MYPCGVSQASFDRAMDELGPSPEEMESEEQTKQNREEENTK